MNRVKNVENYKDTKIANNEEKSTKFSSKITLKNWHILSELTTLYESKKYHVLFDK